MNHAKSFLQVGDLGNNLIMKRFLRYCVLGSFGMVLYIGVLTTLVEFAGTNPTLSAVVAFLCVVIAVYVPNYFWVFNSTQSHSYCVPRFFIVSTVGLLISTVAMYCAVDVFGLGYVWGEVGATVLVPLWNFLLNSYWAFK